MGVFSKLFRKPEGVSTDSEWGQLIYPDTAPGIIIEREKAEADTKMLVSFTLQAINDCVRLVNETANAEVFFQRYDTMIKHMEWMAKIEAFYPFPHPFPSENLARVRKQRVETINDFIDRSYRKLASQLVKLKTEKGRMKKVDDWYHTMTFYSDKMEDENVLKYTEIWERFQPETYQ